MVRLAESRDLVDKLLSVLKMDRVHPTLAGYFSKVFECLFRSEESVVLKAIFEGHYEHDFIRLLNSRSIAEALGKIIWLDERTPQLYLSNRIELVNKVVSLIDQASPYETCANASNLLVETIARGKDIDGWAVIVQSLSSPAVLEKLIKQLGCPEVNVLRSAVAVLSALCKPEVLNIFKSPDQEESTTLMRDEDEVPLIVHLLTKVVKNLPDLLSRCPAAAQPSTFGASVSVLGEGRLKLIEFANTVLRIQDAAIVKAVAECTIIETITALFQEFCWHSLLHGAYEQLVLVVLQSSSMELKSRLLISAKLPKVLIRLCADQAQNGRGLAIRRGSLGHVTRLANILENASKIQDYIRGVLDATKGWRQFYTSTITLQNETESRRLDGAKSRNESISFTSEEEEIIDIKPSVTYTQRFSSWKKNAAAKHEEIEDLE